MSVPDLAPAIAAHLIARAGSPRPDPDFLGTVRDLWPEASHDEARRGLLIAHELIEAELAELRAVAPPPRPEPGPARRAAIVAGVAAILARCGEVEDLGPALREIGRAFPDATWSTFLDGMGLAGPMWPQGEGR